VAAQQCGGAFTWKPAALGIGSGALFAVAAIGFRGGIRALDEPSFVVAATVILALGLLIQTAAAHGVSGDLRSTGSVRDFSRLAAVDVCRFMGAFASQMWFLAFALESAAKVRTLALVEILFAQILSRNLFKQNLASREAVGIGLIIVGVVCC
jgi:uncharacterized membrane protein